MLDIEITKLYKSEIDKIVNWYNQSDKGWLYCDDPSYTVCDIKSGLEYNYALAPDDPNKVHYYMIKLRNPYCHKIGFAIVRQGFDHFTGYKGISIGLDITESDNRNKGCGSVAVRKLLWKLNKERPQIKKIYLETLSYNEPMKKIAEQVGFQLIDCKDVKADSQRGFEEHIDDISKCLNITTDKLLGQKVCALLYELDLANWPKVELRELSESDKGLFDNVEFSSDYVDISDFDYKDDEKVSMFVFFEKNTLVGGVKTEFYTCDNSCKISDYFIVDKFQGCGYGKQALDKTINLIKSNGRFKIDKVELEVRYENLSALTLYWKTGFRPVAFDCFSYWTMELIIDDYS